MRLTIALVLILTGCATRPANPRADLRVTLTGIQEVPGPGDADGTGTAEIRVDPGESRLCWQLYVRQIDPATQAHIHRAAEGSAGPAVVPLGTPGADGHSEGCQAIDQALARQLVGGAHNFYVNVHNQAFPQGAIRGQLRGGPISRVAPPQRR